MWRSQSRQAPFDEPPVYEVPAPVKAGAGTELPASIVDEVPAPMKEGAWTEIIVEEPRVLITSASSCESGSWHRTTGIKNCRRGASSRESGNRHQNYSRVATSFDSSQSSDG
jgi:hypothetical protein